MYISIRICMSAANIDIEIENTLKSNHRARERQNAKTTISIIRTYTQQMSVAASIRSVAVVRRRAARHCVA